MRCDSNVVVLDSWDATYEVHLRLPVDVRSTKHGPGRLRKDFARMNLAEWNKAAGQNRIQRIALPWPHTTLEIVNRQGKTRCEFTVRSQVTGSRAPYVLLERTFERNCH